MYKILCDVLYSTALYCPVQIVLYYTATEEGDGGQGRRSLHLTTSTSPPPVLYNQGRGEDSQSCHRLCAVPCQSEGEWAHHPQWGQSLVVEDSEDIEDIPWTVSQWGGRWWVSRIPADVWVCPSRGNICHVSRHFWLICCSSSCKSICKYICKYTCVELWTVFSRPCSHYKMVPAVSDFLAQWQ